MLFCLLHPMDHNTGPLARKSTTLCALLLVSIAALLVFAVPGQANVEEVGVANHTLEKDGKSVTLKPVSKQAGVDLTYAEYKKLFPTVCNFSINKDNIELLYDSRGCTVELITEKKMDMIKLKTGVFLDKDGCKLGKCADSTAEKTFRNGFSNLLPFAYSRNNMDIKNLNNGPLYDKTTKCAEIKDCGGTCMKETFLEVSWSQCLGFVYAHTHLIGELAIGKNYRYETKGGDKKEFNVEIYANSSFKMDHNKNSQLFDTNEILCATTKGIAIVRPETWKIIKGDLKDKYLLVFHLLPQTATRWVEGNQIKEPPSNLKPNCDLFIHFDRQIYEFLQVDPQTTTTSTTTTATTTTTNPDATSPPAEKTSTSRPQQETTTKAATTTTTATEEGSKIWIWAIVFFVVFSVCLLIAAGAYRGYIIYEDQQKKKQEAEKQEAEDQLQRTYWLNAGDDDAIEDQNNKRVTADMPKLEDQFVNEIYDRMKKEDTENAAMNKKMLFELYLPALEDKGFEVVGTFNEWKKKSGLIQEKGETLKEFNAKVQKAIVNQSKAAERKKTKDDKAKKDKTPKDPASKKDPAPDKSDAARSKQAGTTSDIPTDMMSEAKGTDK
uniref:Uncharacterized protein n=1 Tax=Meloidogyne enterolobii TaxID=390850 RepID=A0A6V7X146_MELEN|nr:unnamed protein product [Meloidogyne enterolobii]